MNSVSIIGAGPAAIAAACTLAQAGINSTIIDETQGLGGKVLGHAQHSLDIEARQAAHTLQTDFEKYNNQITVIQGIKVFGIDSDKIIYLSSTQKDTLPPANLKSQAIIIANGALERSLPFPGWTLPGIMTLGASNTLIQKGIKSGKKMVIAGSGPLLLLLAANLLQAGVDLKALVQLAPCSDFFKHIPALTPFPWKLYLGMQAAWRLLKNRVPIYNGYMVSHAKGKDQIEEVSIKPVNPNDPSPERTWEVDSLAIAYGMIPNLDLTRQAGCSDWFDPQHGYFRVALTDHAETSIPGIFAAGDNVLIRGYAAAKLSGQLAGLGVLNHLGQTQALKDIKTLQQKLKRYNNFGLAWDILSYPPPNILENLPDSTIICRCEDLSLGELKNAFKSGCTQLNELKRRTRLGMGHCQGRICSQNINNIFGQWLKSKETFTARLPARCVTFGDLAN